MGSRLKEVASGIQLPRVPRSPVGWSISDAVLVLLGAQLLSLVWASVIFATAYGGDDPPDPIPIVVGVVANAGLWAGYFLGPVLVARSRGNGPMADFGVRLERSDVPLWIAFGVFVQLAVLPVLYWPILRMVDGDPSEPAKELVSRVDGPLDWVVLTFSVVVIAPIVEELFYRGLFLRAVQLRFGSVAAVVVTAAIFALVHRQLLPLPGLFVFGALAAIAALYTGRLGPAWAMHVGFNATTVVVLGFTG